MSLNGHTQPPTTTAPTIIGEERLSETTLIELSRPPDPKTIRVNDFDSKRPDFEYLPGRAIMRTANELFGADGWQYMLLEPMSFHETPDRNNRKQGFYRAQVSVQIRGIGSREGVGCQPLATDTPIGHDTAMAGALTKALKRAFLTLGPRFGLDLRSSGGKQNAARTRNRRRESETDLPW